MQRWRHGVKCWETLGGDGRAAALFLIIRGAGGEHEDEPVRVGAYLCRVEWEQEEMKICGLNSFWGTEIFF